MMKKSLKTNIICMDIENFSGMVGKVPQDLKQKARKDDEQNTPLLNQINMSCYTPSFIK
jgi:hypothetical protein